MAAKSTNEQQPPAKKRKVDYSEIVTINQKRIMVHTDLLCATSTYFQTAFSERWRAKKDKTIDLTELSEQSFLTYTNWLYTGEFDIECHDEERIDNSHPARRPLIALFECLITGDYLGDTKFMM